MRVFVASWFFPPSSSSEGMVTYKLLRNSSHTYDVCSSLSQQWSYKATMPLVADNITALPISTDDLDEWMDACVALFEEHHALEPYDAIMTRSMPPESIEVGKRIHDKYPDIPWIASLADPIAKSPYDIKTWVMDASDMSARDRDDFMYALKNGVDNWRDSKRDGFAQMCWYKDIEDVAINHADALIFPHECLRSYVLGSRRRANAHVVPHSFDESLYPAVERSAENGRITFAFTGHSDQIRSLEPFVRAVQRLKTIDHKALDRLDIRFIGHVNEEVRALIYNYDLHDVITMTPDVSYIESLRIMEEADWLVHVDAFFDFLPETGGSVYFAGKIADYMGTDTPVFAITGKHSPAYEIVHKAGGVCFERDDVNGIAEALSDIVDGTLACTVDRAYRDRYNAVAVAAEFDAWIEQLCSTEDAPFERATWPAVEMSNTPAVKFLSICVPAYNVGCYLDRCLHSLVSSPAANQLEIIIVNDGSTDNTAQIASAYRVHYPNIIKVIDKENGGHGSAINAALAVAQGIYFRVVDGDDWVDGANLNTLVNNMRSRDLWPDLVSSNYDRLFAESGIADPWFKKNEDLEDYVVYNLADIDATREYFTMASMMAKTELLRALDFKLQEHTFYVDVEFLLFAIPYIETVMFTPEPVYRYAVGNASQSINPTVFASRYDHHNRVIRRMIAYYADHLDMMGEGQRSYMKSLFLRHLLATHYELSLILDPDKQRGFDHAKDFDDFLKATAPDLYSEFGKTHPTVLAVRAAGFNASVVPRPPAIDIPGPGEMLRKASYVIARNPVGYKIVHNDLLRGFAMRFVR